MVDKWLNSSKSIYHSLWHLSCILLYNESIDTCRSNEQSLLTIKFMIGISDFLAYMLVMVSGRKRQRVPGQVKVNSPSIWKQQWSRWNNAYMNRFKGEAQHPQPHPFTNINFHIFNIFLIKVIDLFHNWTFWIVQIPWARPKKNIRYRLNHFWTPLLKNPDPALGCIVNWWVFIFTLLIHTSVVHFLSQSMSRMYSDTWRS